MAQGTIGIHVAAPNADALLQQIENAERTGIGAVWTTSEGVDGLTLFAAAAVRTERVLLGTAITRAATRHPIGMAQQANVIGQLAPGRLRLGIGPVLAGHAAIYGPGPARSLAHLRAYLKAVRGLLQEGAADIDEAGVVAHAKLAGPPPNIPVMASALQPASFSLCGAVSDGAISWICPASYLRDVALPAMREGAAAAGRAMPPLIMHVPVILSPNVEDARAVMRERFPFYLRVPTYLAMFARAGFPEARDGQWTDAMVEAMAVYGTETAIGDQLRNLLATGATELLVSPFGAGADDPAGLDRLLHLLAGMSNERPATSNEG